MHLMAEASNSGPAGRGVYQRSAIERPRVLCSLCLHRGKLGLSDYSRSKILPDSSNSIPDPLTQTSIQSVFYPKLLELFRTFSTSKVRETIRFSNCSKFAKIVRVHEVRESILSSRSSSEGKYEQFEKDLWVR